MSDEQKIEGMPDGCRLLRLTNSRNEALNHVHWVYALVERIPKPQRCILVAEAEVPPDFRIEDGGAIVAYRSGTGVSLDIHRFNAEVFRIEERDA